MSNTYRYKLDTVCRLMQHDPDAYDYLQSNSLTGRTTADHYRSFSSWEGIRLLYTYLRRDTRFLPDTDKECSITDVSSQDGTVTKMVTGVPSSCNVNVTLRNGESITVSSNARIRRTYKATLVKDEAHEAHSDGE